MTDLSNSRRVMFKATHVSTAAVINAPGTQTAPSTQNAQGVQAGQTKPQIGKATITSNRSTRAFPSAAFVARLQIRPDELEQITNRYKQGNSARRLAGGAKAEPVNRPVLRALRAVRTLVEDKTPGAALRNASQFAKIDPQALLTVANHLVDLRTRAAGKATKALTTINSDYVAQLGAGVPAAALKQKALKAAGPLAKSGVFPPEAKPALDRIAAARQPLPAKPAFRPTPGSVREQALEWAAATAHPLLANAIAPAGLAVEDLKLARFGLADYRIPIGIDPGTTTAAVASFKESLPIEPVGRLHLERIEMTPVGIERGELLHSIPMTPHETVNISHKEWSATTQDFESLVSDELTGYSEKGVSEKADISQASDSESKHSTALNVGVSLSASYASVTLSSNFGYNNTSEHTQSVKDSAKHSSDITSKASSRSRKEHKVTFKVSSVVGAEDLAVRTITNSTDSAVRYDYYQLVRKWRVDLIRYGLRMTYDIVIPSPGAMLMKKVDELSQLENELNAPFTFGLTPDGLTRDNWMEKAATWQAEVEPPPPETDQIVTVKAFQTPDKDNTQYDSVSFEVDEQYIIKSATLGAWYTPSSNNQDPTNPSDSHNSWFDVLGEPPGPSVGWGGYGSTLDNIAGQSGTITLPFSFLRILSGTIQTIAELELKPEAFAAWQMKTWGTLYQAAQNIDQLNRQRLGDRAKQLQAEIEAVDVLDLRQMEREEIMKGVLRWLFGPTFELVPGDVTSLFTSGGTYDALNAVLDPGSSSMAGGGWETVMSYGEFIKYIHNAIEWENVLYINYPYFWDNPANWPNKLFLNHWDPQHRMFLRSGAARVVLTIRPGFEAGFTFLMEGGAFGSQPTSPYVSIAQEIQNFASTNYPGIAPANPDTNVRPLLYLEQRRTWRTMQYIIQLLEKFRADPVNSGGYPGTAKGLAALQPYCTDVNKFNSDLNTSLGVDDPEQQLPTFANVPLTDDWGNAFVYKCPGTTGDYDLISLGADGKEGGTDKNADISANADGSLVSQWFEYTPTSAMDLSMTVNLPTTQQPDMA